MRVIEITEMDGNIQKSLVYEANNVSFEQHNSLIRVTDDTGNLLATIPVDGYHYLTID